LRYASGVILAVAGLHRGHGFVPDPQGGHHPPLFDGLLTPDSARRTYHSKEAVDRYIRGFERVRLLASKFAREELPLLTGMSASLVHEYLRLIHDYNAHTKEVREDAAASS
jgi:hypothetical protein